MSGLFWASIVLCLAVGAAIDTSNICLVRATRDLLLAKPGMMIGILLVTACASVIFYVNTALALHHRTPTWSYPNWITCAGAALFAVGSILNGACAIGTVRRLARGDIGHLATFAGALLVIWLLPRRPIVTQTPDLALLSGAAWLAVMLTFTLFIVVLGRRHLKSVRLGSYVVLGITTALVTDWVGSWTWLGVFEQVQTGLQVQPAALACIAAVLAGATLAAIVTGRFHPVRPDPHTMLRELAGGGLMVAGAILIPGGNDALSVYGVPSGSPNAVTGYVLMFALLLAVQHAQRRWFAPAVA